LGIQSETKGGIRGRMISNEGQKQEWKLNTKNVNEVLSLEWSLIWYGTQRSGNSN